jgi:hypothetical protein
MSRLKAYKVDALIVAGFLILPLLLFGTVALANRTMLPADNLFQWQPWAAAADAYEVPYPHNGLLSDLILENYAWKQFIKQAVQERQIPLWNPHIFAGTPFLATGQHSAYYPFSLIFLILPLDKAYGWYTISQLWLAGVFAYFFGRVLGLRRPSAALAGLIFQGCGFLLVSSAVFPMILGAAIWLPLLLASLEMVIRHASSPAGSGRTLPWAALGAIALGAQILAGHIEITYYTLLVMAFYAAWRLLTRLYQLWRQPQLEAASDRRYSSLLRPIAWLMGLVLIGLMLGAIQFVPFLEVGQANFREGSATLAQIRGWAFPLRRLLTFVAPDFFGNPADHSYFDVFSGKQVSFVKQQLGHQELRRRGHLPRHSATHPGHPWRVVSLAPETRSALRGRLLRYAGSAFGGLYLWHASVCTPVLWAARHQPTSFTVPVGVSPVSIRGLASRLRR